METTPAGDNTTTSTDCLDYISERRRTREWDIGLRRLGSGGDQEEYPLLLPQHEDGTRQYSIRVPRERRYREALTGNVTTHISSILEQQRWDFLWVQRIFGLRIRDDFPVSNHVEIWLEPNVMTDLTNHKDRTMARLSDGHIVLQYWLWLMESRTNAKLPSLADACRDAYIRDVSSFKEFRQSRNLKMKGSFKRIIRALAGPC